MLLTCLVVGVRAGVCVDVCVSGEKWTWCACGKLKYNLISQIEREGERERDSSPCHKCLSHGDADTSS